jgi:hypothetical protein
MDRLKDTDFVKLAFCYLENQISAAELVELQKMLLEPAIQDIFVELCLTRRGMIELTRRRAQGRREVSSETSSSNQFRRPPSLGSQHTRRAEPEHLVIAPRLSDTMILPAIHPDSFEAEDVALPTPASWTISTGAPSKGRLRNRMLRAAAIMTPLVCLAGWWAIHSRHRPQTVQGSAIADTTPLAAPVVPPLPALATVTHSLDAQWDHTHAAYDSASITPGTHTLDHGIAELQLQGGAQIILQAPAQFEVLSNNRIELASGRLSAKVPHPSKGLTVHSPDVQIVDLGTEFGMDVVPERKTHVEVFVGQVRAELPPSQAGSSKNQIVDAGQAVAVKTGASIIDKDAPEPLDFVRSDELAARVAAGGNSSLPLWRAFSETIRRDPDLLAYYTFEDRDGDPQRLTNHAIATQGRHDGSLGLAEKIASAPEWSQGRWPGKGALHFGDHSNTAVMLAGGSDLIPTSNLSVLFWIKRSEPVFPVHLINQASGSKGSFNISLTGTAGKPNPTLLPDSIYFNFGRGTEICMPRLLPTDDNWLFVAITVDANHVTHFYLNGELVMQAPIKILGSIDSIDRTDRLCIGGVSPGNIEASGNDIFRGWMDELALFRRTVSAAEIKRMYDTGRP